MSVVRRCLLLVTPGKHPKSTTNRNAKVKLFSLENPFWLNYAQVSLGRLFFDLALRLCGCRKRTEPGQPAHHVVGGFRNPNADFSRPSTWTRWSFVVRRLWTTSMSPRTFVVPRVANDGAILRAGSVNPSITWIGHSTLLVQINGVNILTDPQWSERASPVSWGGPRRLKPSRARIRRFASHRCCVDLSRSLRPSGPKHRKAPCRSA